MRTQAAGLTVSEKKTETMLLRTPNPAIRTSPLVIEAAGQSYMQTMQFLYLGGLVDASADIMPEMKRRIRPAWACYNRLKRELYVMEDATFTLKVRMLKAEVVETLLYGCVTWTLGQEHFAELRTAHHKSSHGSLTSSANNALTTSCRTPRLSRRHNARALRRPSAKDSSSLRGPYNGRPMSG